jgi:hypothetical protein
MEPDHTGLQPETGVEPGELGKTDGGGGLNRPAAPPVREKGASSNL